MPRTAREVLTKTLKLRFVWSGHSGRTRSPGRAVSSGLGEEGRAPLIATVCWGRCLSVAWGLTQEMLVSTWRRQDRAGGTRAPEPETSAR
jgi:hypothetical protein